MKYINYIIISLMLLTALGCQKDTVSFIDPAGDFAANFTFPEGEITAPAKVVLTNRSKYSDKYEWKFENAKQLLEDGTIVEATTSDKIVPDTLYYELPGTYSVTLTAWNGSNSEVVTKDVIIKKMSPQIIVPENIGVYLDVTFSAKAFNYPGQDLTYNWNFGEAGTSTAANPTVKFTTEGEHIVTLTVNDGQESLTTTAKIFVQGELTTSLYFTDVVSKKLYRYAFKELSAPTLESYDVNIGTHPLAMQVYNNRVYIANAGNNVYYAASAAGDGRIFSVDLKGANESVIGANLITAAAGYQSDPFNFIIDPNTNMLFYLSRNFNVKAVSVNASSVDLGTVAQRIAINATQAGVTSVYNWIDGGIQIVGSELWYSKQGNGKGLYKFNMSTNTFVSRLTAFDNFSIRNFIVDQMNNKIYFVLNNIQGTYEKGLYKSNLDGSNIQLIDALIDFSPEGSGTENVSISSLTMDQDANGYLYYGYRSASDVSANGTVIGNGQSSGIKKYKLDGSESATFLIKGYVPYGIALDHVKR